MTDDAAKRYRPPPAHAQAQAQPAQAQAQLLPPPLRPPPPLFEALASASNTSPVTRSTPLRFTKPPDALEILMEPGRMDAANPPIVDSVHPAKDPATSPNVVRP
ncbi:MAG: hypothetical protein ACP5JG_12595, partial [Anaerolineae bacterium]